MKLNIEQTRQIRDLLSTAHEVEEVLDNEVRPSKTRAAKHEAARMLLRTKDTLQFVLEQYGISD